MKIIQVSSTGVCGIAVYTDRLCESFRNKGHEVIRLAVSDEDNKICNHFSKDAVLHIQWEPSFLDRDRAAGLLNCARTSGMTSLATLHYSTKSHCDALAKSCKYILLHKNNGEDATNIKYVPMGCPVFKKTSRSELRRKYNINEGSLVVSTFGFLVSWKKFDTMIEEFTPLFHKYPSLVLQMLTSFHKKMEGDSFSVYNQVRKILDRNNVLDKVIWKTDFLPENEMLERLALSNVGFVYAPVDTGSISAAQKEFVAARLPAVFSSSTHFADISVGCLKVPKNVTEMVEGIETLIEDNVLRNRLEKELDELYTEINYDKVADKHLEIYRS